MPLASVIAHTLNGWGPPQPSVAVQDVGGATSRPQRYTPKPIKNARHRQYSTLYATADAATRKTVRSAELVGLASAADAELTIARAASTPPPPGRSAVNVWSRRTVAAESITSTETGIRAVAGIGEEERSARRRYADSQFRLIVDDDSR